MDLITVNELCNTIVKVAKTVDEKRRKAKRAENRARGRAERKAKRQTF